MRVGVVVAEVVVTRQHVERPAGVGGENGREQPIGDHRVQQAGSRRRVAGGFDHGIHHRAMALVPTGERPVGARVELVLRLEVAVVIGNLVDSLAEGVMGAERDMPPVALRHLHDKRVVGGIRGGFQNVVLQNGGVFEPERGLTAGQASAVEEVAVQAAQQVDAAIIFVGDGSGHRPEGMFDFQAGLLSVRILQVRRYAEQHAAGSVGAWKKAELREVGTHDLPGSDHALRRQRLVDIGGRNRHAGLGVDDPGIAGDGDELLLNRNAVQRKRQRESLDVDLGIVQPEAAPDHRLAIDLRGPRKSEPGREIGLVGQQRIRVQLQFMPQSQAQRQIAEGRESVL